MARQFTSSLEMTTRTTRIWTRTHFQYSPYLTYRNQRYAGKSAKFTSAGSNRTYTTRAPKSKVVDMLFSLSDVSCHRVGISHKASMRSVIILKPIAPTISPLFPHCRDLVLHCGTPHWKDIAKVENTIQTAIMPNNKSLGPRVWATTRSMRKADESFERAAAKTASISAT
jgi:hypothetical protein